MKWELKEIEIKTSSVTCCSEGVDGRVDFQVKENNRDETLTKVKKTWMWLPADIDKKAYAMCSVENASLRALHEMPHMDVESSVPHKKNKF